MPMSRILFIVLAKFEHQHVGMNMDTAKFRDRDMDRSKERTGKRTGTGTWTGTGTRTGHGQRKGQ